MVDPNPVRGMPAHLRAYWLTGKGAAKIRWGMPHDFYRCVRQLRKYFPKDPKGLCANLHHDALAKWPGREHPRLERLSLESQQAEGLLAAAPLGDVRWMAPLAPIGVPTGDGRQFAPDALSFRRFPLPLEWVKTSTTGHQGKVTVGRILGATIGPDESGQQHAWGFGDFFNPADIPEVAQALTLARGGVVGLSLDPGGFVRMDLSSTPNGGDLRVFTSYKAGGATMVSIPAFEGQYMLLGGPDDEFEGLDDTDEYLMMADHMDPDEVEVQGGNGVVADGSDCGCGDLGGHGLVVVGGDDRNDRDDDHEGQQDASHAVHDATFAVNTSGWRGLPLASRETNVDKDDAAKRIAGWANGDPAKLNQAFLWRHPQGDPRSVLSYRLPVGDIINGKLTLVYHAIYAASALLEGAHGGLPNIPDSEKAQLRKVISAIYQKISTDFDDPDIKASWDRAVKRDNGVTPVEKATGNKGDFSVGDDMPLTDLAADILVSGDDEVLAVNASWSLPIAGTGVGWDEGATRRALDSWAGDDLSKYGRAFLWKGASKSEMKFPIATIIDGKLTIVPRAVQAALGRLDSADLPDDAKSRMRSILMGIRDRYTSDSGDGGDGENATQVDVDVQLASITLDLASDGEMSDVTFTLVDSRTSSTLGTRVVQVPTASILTLSDEASSLSASAGPLTPPLDWFAQQPVAREHGLTISPEGRVSGYLASWRQCHMSVGRGRCVRAPRTKTNYSYFHLGSAAVDAGAEGTKTIRVGRLTVGGGHADVSLGVIPATEHYDNAGSAVAVVRAYEDDFGIQVAGAIVPSATPEQVATLRRSPLSGDWRNVNGNLELVAALAVNVPGFPVFAEDEQGHELSLISSGFVEDSHDHEVDVLASTDDDRGVDGPDIDQIADLVSAKLTSRQQRTQRASTLSEQKAFSERVRQARRAEILKSMKGAN